MSTSGCLLKDYLWRDFEMNFDMKYLLDEKRDTKEYSMRYLGIIFGAENLDSYYMLELIVEAGKLYLKPHVRYQGNWEIVDLVEKNKML
ncbi:hypothetical protein HY031_00625 [Candidatus Gottesmanbacteria bacterium]|nr:hypothetical protein [Candidatus Gottesmanbacteria bacterium]